MRERLSLGEICEIAGIDLPEKFSEDKDAVINFIACFANRIIEDNSAFFVRGLLETGKKASFKYNENQARTAIKKGARIIFSEEQYYAENGDELPCIIVENPSSLFVMITNHFRQKFSDETKIIGVTGSVGKTTMTEMLALVSKTKNKTFFSKNNSNGFGSISTHLQKVPFDTGVYIQEVGAYFPGLIEDGAAMLEPDACVITNIGTSHIDLYGSVENIAHDKLALTRHLRKDGMAFINYDDPILRAAQYDCNVTWYSLDNPEADYYAENIVYGDGFLEYDIIGRERRAHIRLSSYGMHNVINSVAAFAFGCWCGIPEKKMEDAFLKFRTEGMRQNYVDIGGYHLYVDCFNSAPNSLEGAIKTVTQIPIGEGKKRIAVLGDMLKMGDLSKELHTECGKSIAKYNIDLYLCYGPYMYYMAEELKKAGCRVMYTKDQAQLDLWLEENMQIGDLILFKSGHRMNLSKTIDAVFGTSFYLTDADIVLNKGKEYSLDDFEIRIVEGKAEIRKNLSCEPVVEVPPQLAEGEVVRIGSDSFGRCKSLQELVISEGIINIGYSAFFRCKSLRKVSFPQTLRIIEQSAFNHCTSLEEIVLPYSVISVGMRAFCKCRSLRKAVIGSNVAFIGKQAFANCPNLTIYGMPGTYAEQYAAKEGIPFEKITME